MNPHWLFELESKGFVVLPDILSASEVEMLRSQAENASGGEHAMRGLLELDWVQSLASSETVRSLIEPVLGADCFAVRGIFFDKIPGANWLVPPHQDLSIAVEKQGEAIGYGPWSRKQGVVHVQPPREVLEKMATLRLHLDDCEESNGALRVVAGSHLIGKLSNDEILSETKRGEVIASVPEGGAMIFHPLLIHASSPSVNPLHRRVVHLEFAASELVEGLKWRWRF
ncbi:phytanoyl-CoA dioxygenase [bacterium]|nr:MAG: phytanoyl-CoA dioxygenase [bacterium]